MHTRSLLRASSEEYLLLITTHADFAYVKNY